MGNLANEWAKKRKGALIAKVSPNKKGCQHKNCKEKRHSKLQFAHVKQTPISRTGPRGRKEKWADINALSIKWLDIDNNKQTISIRYPIKNHLPRTLQVSNRLLSMINALPKKDDRGFPTCYGNMLRHFVTMWKRTAEIHQTPRLLAVDFTVFRTWAGTLIAYYSNGNALKVKHLLGYKQVKNTMKYIGKINFKDRV